MGKFMLTMIHTEMLFVPPIHQPIVAPLAVRRVRDDFRVAFPVAFQNPEDNRFTPGPAPFLPTNTAPAERGFIDFNPAREGR